jgi:hypothetical protein
MADHKETLQRLKNLDDFLASCPKDKKPIHFEKLIAETVCIILNLPLHYKFSTNIRDIYYVQWFGLKDLTLGAPGNHPDVIGHCYDYHFILEATTKSGAKQNDQEYAKCRRHFDDFIIRYNVPRENSYILFIAPKISEDTYNTIYATRLNSNYQFIPINAYILGKILETMTLAFTLMHIDFHNLITDIAVTVKESPKLEIFNRKMEKKIKEWQNKVLESEKSACIGLLTYQLVRNKKTVESTEFSNKLQEESLYKKYKKIIGENINDAVISKALIDYGFARKLVDIDARVELLQITPYDDAKKRFKIFNKTLESIA